MVSFSIIGLKVMDERLFKSKIDKSVVCNCMNNEKV